MSFTWETLDQLKAVAIVAGCTPAQFDEAVETVSSDSNDVAGYLQRYALHWKLPRHQA